MATHDIKEFISPKNLRVLAGGRSFMRGEEYFDEGAVGAVSEKAASSPQRFTAAVPTTCALKSHWTKMLRQASITPVTARSDGMAISVNIALRWDWRGWKKRTTLKKPNTANRQH
ncbi:MAG: hypothetical protein J0665_12435 [Deltaproteobacteria bacterium]|jgi:hypothetical protein|nr:hypothetical protein [Deltaproteobacteria bacterium]